MVRPLVKTHIRGFDEDVLRGGIPQGHVVLVRGASGTMKSSLAYYVLYHNALAGSPGLYVTREQTAAGSRRPPWRRSSSRMGSSIFGSSPSPRPRSSVACSA